MTSALNGANHNTLDKVLLEEGINQQNRGCGNDDSCGFNGFLGNIVHVAHVPDRIRNGIQRRGIEYVTKPDLEGFLCRVGNVEHDVEVGVPVAHGIKEADGGKHGQGQWKDNPEKDLPVVAAVYGRRFLHAYRHGFKEGFHNDHVIGAYGTGQNNCPVGIVKAQGFNKEKVWNHACAEEHGKGNEHKYRASSPEPFFRQGIGCKDGHNHIHAGSHKSEVHGVLHGLQQRTCRKHGLIG